MKQQTHIIFDFDGVLGDTLDSSVKVNIKINNLPQESWQESLEFIKAYLNKPKHNRQKNLTKVQQLALLQRYTYWGELLLKEGFDLFENFLQELETLHKNGTKMAVVTSGSTLYVKSSLSKYAHIFDEILTIEDDLSKENKLEKICDNWGITAKDVLYITDTTGDYYELSNCMPKENIYACVWGWHGKEFLEKVFDFSKILYHFSDIHFVGLKPKIVILGGGEVYGSDEDFKKSLQNSPASFRTQIAGPKWKDWILTTYNLNLDFNSKFFAFSAYLLNMPNCANAKYEEWKIEFEKTARFLTSKDILIGHSLGGIFLLKYLSQNSLSDRLKSLHLVAPPFNQCFSFNFDLADLNLLCKQVKTIHFYHSLDDKVVPFSDFLKFKESFADIKISQKPNEKANKKSDQNLEKNAEVFFHEFTDKNHFLQSTFEELLNNFD